MAVITIAANMIAGLGQANLISYASVHDAPNSVPITLPPFAMALANSLWAGPAWEVYRIELSVDTSPLGAGATITNAVLSPWLARPAHGTEDDPGQAVIHVVEGVHGAVPVVADYGLLLPQVVSGGVGPAYAAVLAAPGSRHDITLNAAGRSWINPAGTTKFGLRLFGDINSLVPTGWNDVELYSARDIELTIVYTPAPVVVAPTVTTDPASAISQISATLNGTLDTDGGEACECGFEWGLTPAYGYTTPTQSRITGQTFSQIIGGLNPGTTYHFRAFATNSAGTGYGADRSFTTAPTYNRAYALSREEL